MKFILTSAGITNKSIAKTVTELVGKPANKIKALFIPTAANLILDDKTWLIDNLIDFKKQEYESIDILDIASVSEKEWRPRFEKVDLICFGGGNEQYLAKVLLDSGVAKALPELLKTRVYMGISAGSMVAGQFLSKKLLNVVYPEEMFEELALPLKFVNYLFIPHLNSKYFTHVRKDVLEKLRKDFSFPLYACDDASAITIVDGKVEVVGEGKTLNLTTL